MESGPHESSEQQAGPSHVRGSARVACERCRGRKIKVSLPNIKLMQCDGARPRCAGCEKSDAQCVYLGGNSTRQYVQLKLALTLEW